MLEPIATFEQHAGWSVYRSDAFPHYYGGNGLELDAPGRSLHEWEDLFRAAFDPAVYGHVTLSLSGDLEAFAPLADEARAAGYHVSVDVYLVATKPVPVRAPLPGLQLEWLRGQESWDRLRRFEGRLAQGYDWYDGPESSDGLFAKTRFISEQIGIEWVALVDGQREIRSKLGLFRHGRVCRLQDVATERGHRRRGLATRLLAVALRRALIDLEADGLVVCAEQGHDAISLYRRLGFQEVGEAMTLMRYPVRNPQATENPAPSPPSPSTAG